MPVSPAFSRYAPCRPGDSPPVPAAWQLATPDLADGQGCSAQPRPKGENHGQHDQPRRDHPLDRIIQGDATATLKTMPSNAIDLILTDPPYLVNYRDRSGRTVANDDALAAVLPAFAEMYRVLV